MARRIINNDDMIKELQKPLDIKDIDFRVGEVRGSTKVYATILAYKNARVDMERLDSVTGGLWQNEYRRDTKNILQCGIGIKIESEWVWKWSNGTESTFEKEKGEYSDAFKRAGFMWGIGRELYDFPLLLVELRDGEYQRDSQGKIKATYKLKPNDWEWSWEGSKLVARQNGVLRLSASADDVLPQEAPSTTQAPKTQPGVSSGSWEDYVMPFGKHKGKTMREIDETTPDYLTWLSAQESKNPELTQALAQWADALPGGLR